MVIGLQGQEQPGAHDLSLFQALGPWNPMLHNVPSTVFRTLTPQDSLLKGPQACLLSLYGFPS